MTSKHLIQYGSNWFNYLIYREWPDGSYTLTYRNGKPVRKLSLVEGALEYVNNFLHN